MEDGEEAEDGEAVDGRAEEESGEDIEADVLAEDGEEVANGEAEDGRVEEEE